MDVQEIENRVNEISERFGIRSILDKYPYQISGDRNSVQLLHVQWYLNPA